MPALVSNTVAVAAPPGLTNPAPAQGTSPASSPSVTTLVPDLLGALPVAGLLNSVVPSAAGTGGSGTNLTSGLPVVGLVSALVDPVLNTVGSVASGVVDPVLNTVGSVVSGAPSALGLGTGTGQGIDVGLGPAPGGGGVNLGVNTGAAPGGTQAPTLNVGTGVSLPGPLGTGAANVGGTDNGPRLPPGPGGMGPVFVGSLRADAAGPGAGNLPIPAVVVAPAPTKAGSAGTSTASATPAPPLSPDLFFEPDPAAATRDVQATPADPAPRASLPDNAPPGNLALDLALWGAANDDAEVGGAAVHLPALHAASRLLAVSSGDATEYVVPESVVDATAAGQADLLTRCTPFDAQALDAAFQRLLDQLESLAWDFSSLLARLRGTPWFAAAAVLAVTCEVARRRLQQQARRGVALAGGAGGTLTWFPSLTGPAARDDA